MKRAIILIIILTLLLTSCMDFRTAKKDFTSSMSGLDRDITITDFYGNVVWEYSGKSLISSSGFGDITISYYEDKIMKKIDFIGMYNMKAIER